MQIIHKEELCTIDDSGRMSKELFDVYLLKERRSYFIHVFNEAGNLVEGTTTKNKEKALDMYVFIRSSYRKQVETNKS